MGKIIWNCSSWKTRSNSVKEVGLKKVNESYLVVISFVLFIEIIGSPPPPSENCSEPKIGQRKRNYPFIKTNSGIRFIETDIYSFLLFCPFVLL